MSPEKPGNDLRQLTRECETPPLWSIRIPDAGVSRLTSIVILIDFVRSASYQLRSVAYLGSGDPSSLGIAG